MDDRLSTLEAMKEELGNQRLQELPLEDQPRRQDPNRFVQSVRVAPSAYITNLSDKFKNAIMAGQFEDSDAAAVRGLDDLGGPRLHARNSQDYRPPHAPAQGKPSAPPPKPITQHLNRPVAVLETKTESNPIKKPARGLSSSRWAVGEKLEKPKVAALNVGVAGATFTNTFKKDEARLGDKKPASNDQFAPLVADLYSRHKSPTLAANSNAKREVVLFQIPASLHVSELKRSPCQVIGLVRDERETRFEIKLESGNSKSHNILDLLTRQRKDQVCSLNFRTQDNEIVHYILTFESLAGASFFVLSLDNFGDAIRAKLNERLKRFNLTEAGFSATDTEADRSVENRVKQIDVGVPQKTEYTVAAHNPGLATGFCNPVLSKTTATLLGSLEFGSNTSDTGQDTRTGKSERLTYSVKELRNLESGAIESSSNVKAVCSQIRSPTATLAYPAPDASAGPGVDRGKKENELNRSSTQSDIAGLDETERIRKQMMAQVKWLTGQGSK